MDKKNGKQKLLLEYLISSPDTFAICKSIIKADYFNPEFRKVVTFLHDYFDKYSSTPDVNQINVETNIKFEIQIITKDKIAYCADEIEKFCKGKALDAAVIQASHLVGSKDEDKIEQIVKDAIMVSLTKDMGVQYFDNPLTRLEEYSNQPQRIPTMWHEVDLMLGGGLARTEILLVSANSGGGKSITLANLAVNMVMQNLNVLYITLEMAEKMVAQRFDTMFTGISSVNWIPRMHDIADALEHIGPEVGKLTIKRMPSGTNCNTIRSYLKEYELKLGIIPDLLIVDYLDIMNPNEKVSADNVSEKDKRSTEQLKDILEDYNMMGATASQQTRGAIDAAELNQSHIAGGITKVNTVDWYISIVMTPTMKLAGEMMWIFLKSRSSDAVGKTINLIWDNNHLRIRNLLVNKEGDADIALFKQMSKQHSTKRKSLKDLMIEI